MKQRVRRLQQPSSRHEKSGQQESNPRTLSEISTSTYSTQQSSIPSIFSRDGRDQRSIVSDDSIDPSDSASQVQYSAAYNRPGAGAKGPPPRGGGGGGGNQPDPDSINLKGMSLYDSNRPNPNQSAQRTTTTNTKDRHGAQVKDAKDAKDDDNKPRNPRQDPRFGGNTSSNRKDQLYDYH